jgi:anti-sigma factor RsiW
MKHPNREQLIAFLYEDCDRAEKSEIAQHLDSCAACQQQLQQWRQTASALNAYTVPPASLSLWERVGVRALRRAWLPLSAAAAIVLSAGVAIGSSLQSRANPASFQQIAELRARVEKSEAESALSKKVLGELVQSIAENRNRDQAALLTVAKQLQATRKDLETVAANTATQLVRLASYTPDN